MDASSTAVVLAVVLAGAAVACGRLPASLPRDVAVSAADSSGVNLLEPASPTVPAAETGPSQKAPREEVVERTVAEWTATGGGSGFR